MFEPPQPHAGVVEIAGFLYEAESQQMVAVAGAEKEEPAIAATLAETNTQQNRSAKA
jgi:hypothetical protein